MTLYSCTWNSRLRGEEMSSLKTAILYTIRLIMLQQTDFECCLQNQYNSLQQRLPAVLTLMRPPVVSTHPHVHTHTHTHTPGKTSVTTVHTNTNPATQTRTWLFLQLHSVTQRRSPCTLGFLGPEVCNLTGITVLGITLPDSIKMKKKTPTHKTQTYFPSQANNKLI